MARIRIYIGRHLCTAPRPQKEADALAAAGHEVSVHGMAYRADFSERDAAIAAGRAWRWEPAVDYSRADRRGAWFLARVRHRLARSLFARTGLVLPDVWGYGTSRLAAHALRSPADLTLVHSEGGLWFADRLLRAGHRVGVDFEDWFSHDLTPAQRHGRPVALLEQLERRLLLATPYALAPSRSMAEAMAAKFRTPAPSVIYNTFAAGPDPAPSPAEGRPVSFHWFSLVLGPERGLETLFDALPAVDGSWELVLRGESTATYREALLSRLPEALRPRIRFLPTVPAAELPAALAAHDVGLALEVNDIPSRDLTITNKFFHYLQAGLAIAASDTAGHREGLSLAPGAGHVFPNGDSAALATLLRRWTKAPSELLSARRASRAAFVSRLAHEHQTGTYAALVGKAPAR
jgi:hypothetical protein